jgi:phosphatidylglycerol:prolipoprotein diacylglycerol transferase
MSFIIEVPAINPIALEMGYIAIRWYSLAYILGILSALFFLKKFNQKYHLMTAEAEDSWLNWAILGIIIGGRLGYVLFYNFSFYLSHPLEILKVWQGGMSFHGGLIGSVIAMYFFCQKYRVNFLKLCDCLAIISPIGIFFGRVANFINLELYGRATNSETYGFIFVALDQQKRHPSQLYEAVLEGIVPFLILYFFSKTSKTINKSGFLSGLFLILYGSARIFVENFREPDFHIGFVVNQFTMGQILSLPIFLTGLFLIYCAKNENKKKTMKKYR